jgi:riboflavin kinase
LLQIVFLGTIFSGTGQGRKFIDLPWVKRQIEEKLGFTPYSGTLNLRLTKESIEKKTRLETTEEFVIEPQAGYCRGVMFRAQIGSIHGAIVVPRVPNYPVSILEVIAPVYLREHLKLADGNQVTVTVSI